jgi:transposase
MVPAMAEKTSVLEEANAALKARSLDAEERNKRLMQTHRQPMAERRIR